eukprot:TRINITY_DN32836_c0_g2_i1.p1 TRINITY_DN32836_c0_g2~~TRINITY_DN32836_c0_g2_i1.p1  ORF type:complete len:1121 (+),score=299.94 TRINITY_DN32836_c0_g2_i1:74-3364(+)
MAPAEELAIPTAPLVGSTNSKELDEWTNEVDEVTAQIHGIIDGTITDFEAFDQQYSLKQRAKEIRKEEAEARREKFFRDGCEGKGEGERYKWWCKRCFVEYYIDLPENTCTRCHQSDKMMTQQDRRAELMDKVEDFKVTKARHQWRKDKWVRWKKSQAMLKRSRNTNYKAWEYWEPDTESEDEGDPIVPRDNPEFKAMEADMKQRNKKKEEKAKTAERCRLRGNQSMKEGDFVGAIEHYEEGLEYRREAKNLWTNKALAELKVFRWHDAVASCNKVIEYSEIFEECFEKSRDACFKAFTRRAMALRGLHRWEEALEDLEDAMKLYPKDKEAKDLWEKTKAACEESGTARKMQEDPDTAAETASTAANTEDGTTEKASVAGDVASPGTVRVEIEESDEEDEEEDAAQILKSSSAPQAGSLTSLSKQDFAQLVKKLKSSNAERIKFCARKGGDAISAPAKKEDKGRKIDLKTVEEVAEASRLDGVLKDAERCCILWKKRRPNAQGKVIMQDDEPEAKEADAFVSLVAPRLIAVLHVLATSSDHHCALTAPAIKHIWPLLAVDALRYDVLRVLMEWSQRSISGKAMADFASRYPEPHVSMLISILNTESKDSLLPPGFEDRAKKAADRLELGQKDVESALEEVMQGLMTHSPVELAVSTLGNVCLAGQPNPIFREAFGPLSKDIVAAIARHLRPLDWRVCGRAAGAICNTLRLGDTFAGQVQEQCTKPLVTALKEECKAGSPGSKMKDMFKGQGNIPGVGDFLPSGSTARLLGALLNLVIVRPAALIEVRELGTLELIVPLIDPAADPSTGSAGSLADDEGGPGVIASRAALLTARLLGTQQKLPQNVEVDLLQRLFRMLDGMNLSAVKASLKKNPDEKITALEWIDPAIRMLTIMIMKIDGVLDRLTDRAPRIEELPDDIDELPSQEAAVSFADLVARLTDLAIAIQPREHVSSSGEGLTASRLRGNLALLFGHLSDAQAAENAPPAIRELRLSALCDVFIDTLKKERGAVQSNIGVCVTKLAQNPLYRQKVRDLNGIESLHQIQLPKVNAKKAEEMRKHRLETSQEDKKAEIVRRLRDQQDKLEQHRALMKDKDGMD